MILDHTLTDGQTNARSDKLAFAVQSLKYQKSAVEVVPVEADTCIGHVDLVEKRGVAGGRHVGEQRAARLSAAAYPHAGWLARPGKCQRIREQILQQLGVYCLDESYKRWIQTPPAGSVWPEGGSPAMNSAGP